MPQYDTDPTILRERAYAEATTMILVDGRYEEWEAYSDAALREFREQIREDLLYEFPNLDGPTIAEEMDAALHDHVFPFHQI